MSKPPQELPRKNSSLFKTPTTQPLSTSLAGTQSPPPISLEGSAAAPGATAFRRKQRHAKTNSTPVGVLDTAALRREYLAEQQAQMLEKEGGDEAGGGGHGVPPPAEEGEEVRRPNIASLKNVAKSFRKLRHALDPSSKHHYQQQQQANSAAAAAATSSSGIAMNSDEEEDEAVDNGDDEDDDGRAVSGGDDGASSPNARAHHRRGGSKDLFALAAVMGGPTTSSSSSSTVTTTTSKRRTATNMRSLMSRVGLGPHHHASNSLGGSNGENATKLGRGGGSGGGERVFFHLSLPPRIDMLTRTIAGEMDNEEEPSSAATLPPRPNKERRRLSANLVNYGTGK